MNEITTGADGAWSYRTGAWFAIFGGRATVLLPDSQKDQVVRLWELVDGGAGFDEVLDGLLASGLSKLPGFVLVSTDDGPTRILLRGQGVSATLTGDGEDVVLDGAASHTWVERSVDGVTALSVTVPGVAGDASDETDETADQVVEAHDFPILAGLVRVGRIDRPAVTVSAAAPATAAAPAAPDLPPETTVPPEALADAEAAVEEEAPVDEGIAPVDESTVLPEAVGGLTTPPVSVSAPLGGAHLATDNDLTSGTTTDDAATEDAAVPDDDALTGADMTDDAPTDDAPTDGETTGDEMTGDVTDEPSPLDDDALSAAPADDAVATEMMEVVDPLADPLGGQPDAGEQPRQPAPDGWVTPWDTPPAPPVGEPDPLAETDTPAVPPSPFPPVGGETEIAPPGWTPPPPPGAVADVDAPPLPIGSWEPVGGVVPPPPGPPGGLGGDHDGMTVAGAGEHPEPPPAPGIPGQPPAPAVTPPVAKLIVSDGQTIVVDRAVLVGRAPEARRFTSTEQPTLVTVPSRLHEISSTHVEIRPGTGADHGSAVVTDMGSTNGTVLVQPGLGPEDLKPGIAVQLIPGAVINLGDGVTIQVTRP